MSQIFNQPFGITWRKAVLSAPRFVPDAILRYTSPDGPHPIVIKIPSRDAHLIPLYVFIPEQQSTSDVQAKLPVLLDFHGGGFVFGSCQEQAPWCAKIARELNAVSISVDYRMGPACKFPAAIEDGEDVTNAVLDPSKPGGKELRDAIKEYLVKSSCPATELDTTRVAFSGFSSGGNLALNLGISIPQSTDVQTAWPTVLPASFPSNIPLILFYPALDCRQLPDKWPIPSGMKDKKTFLEGLRLETDLRPTYLPRHQASHPRASPGLATLKDGGLHAQARMMLILPELDTLAAQSDVWIEKVEAEGMSSVLSVEKVPAVAHGWTQFPDSWLSEEHKKLKWVVFDEAKEFIVKAWGTSAK